MKAKNSSTRGNYLECRNSIARFSRKFRTTISTHYLIWAHPLQGPKSSKQAEEIFSHKAIAVALEDSFSHCTLGIVYYSQGKYDEAVNELTKTLAIDPKNATAHNYLGITCSQKGWQDAAQKELEKAVTSDASYARCALQSCGSAGDETSPTDVRKAQRTLLEGARNRAQSVMPPSMGLIAGSRERQGHPR